MYKALLNKEKKISVIGLGYVGLPIALEFAKHFSVIGFDINESRIAMMREGIDPSKELNASSFENVDIEFTSNLSDLKEAHFHVVAVPTDIDEYKIPNLTPLLKASETVGKIIKRGDYVVYESTVYPGCTKDDCIPALLKAAESQRVSVTANGEGISNKLNPGFDFKYGYSPERINPGDKKHTLTKILKIVAGNDAESADEISKVYGHIIEAGIYTAPSIEVAEAAKVIENTQRDINIALMNELSMIFDKMNIDTQEVLKAAGTKWNFLKFYPGLVGGHCIGIDPYYLTHKAQQVGYSPQMILSGRRINDGMSAYVAKKLVQSLIQKGKAVLNCKVLIMGITFKEDVADIRNSKVADVAKELMEYSLNLDIVDPYASKEEVEHEYGLKLVDDISNDYDAVIVAVGHNEYQDLDGNYFEDITNNKGILFDLKGLYSSSISDVLEYWRL
jgi:UDP-N-acetyl-D-galactosamine dehydrogenase